MKQETGKTNPSDQQKKVSIQLKLGGHSFSVDTLPAEALAEGAQVAFEVLTPRCMLVPQELTEGHEDGAHYLAAAGMPLVGGECAVWSDAVPGEDSNREQSGGQQVTPGTSPKSPRAVIAVSEAAVEAIRERLGERAHFTTPLLRPTTTQGATVWIYRAEEVLYIKVWEGRLRFAEAVAATTDADMLYFLAQLGRAFPLRNYTLLTSGQEAKPLRKLLGKPFKKALCES